MSMHVLVCDDDKPTRFVIRRLLVQRLGCEVTECGVQRSRVAAQGGCCSADPPDR